MLVAVVAKTKAVPILVAMLSELSEMQANLKTSLSTPAGDQAWGIGGYRSRFWSFCGLRAGQPDAHIAL